MEELLSYYENLLIIQYNNKPKARATIRLLISTLLANNIVSQVNNSFDLNTAIGVQLDTIGKYLDLDRNNDGERLTDEVYRIALKFRAVQNTSDNTTQSIIDSLFNFFGSDIIMTDGQNMTLTYFVPISFSPLISVLVNKNVLPKPMGVGIGYIIESDDYFSFVDAQYTIPDIAVGFATPDDFLTKEGQFLATDNIIG